VATLSLALSGAGAFWLVALAGAVGATERYQTPFATWSMLTVGLLPLYGVSVLGAMMLAKRWFGPDPRWPGKVLTTGLMLVLAGTIVGIAALVASAAYDFSLQVQHITGMTGMSSCTGGCVSRERGEILVLHLRGALLVSEKLLLTNAALVAWIVAMGGGRIKTATAFTGSTGHDGAVERQTAGGTIADDVRQLLVGMLLGAAVIHAAVIPEHLEEWSAAGRFFIVLTIAELAVALLLLARFRERAVLLAAGALSAVPLVAWLWSRTLGLPFGPEPGVAEAVGVPDLLACALEVGAVLAVLALLKLGRLVRPRLSAHTRGLAVLSLVAVTAIGFAATGATWFDAFGVSASQSSTGMSE
jgi:hypothetical protein